MIQMIAVLLLKFYSDSVICSIQYLHMKNEPRFLKGFSREDMPPISKFVPYARGAMVWRLTIYLYLRENPKNAAPIGAP